MSFFGSLWKDVKDVGKVALGAGAGFLAGGPAGAIAGGATALSSELGGHHSVGGPAPQFNLPVPLNPSGNSSGGNVVLPFVGSTHINGPLGNIGQGIQGELSNLTGIPIAGSGSASSVTSGSASSVTSGSGIKQVISYRATRPGYVVVHYNGSAYAVPKEMARRLVDPQTGKKLWHATPKPAVTHHDLVVAKKHKQVEKKLKRVGEKLDLKVEHKLAGRRRSNSRSRKPAIEEAVIIKESK